MKSLKLHWRLWLSIFIGWTLIGLAYTYNYAHYSSNYVKIFRTPPTFREMLVWEMPYWILWAMLPPLIFWLAQRFRLERGSLLRSLPVHIASFIALTLAHRAIYLFIDWEFNVRAYTNLGFLSVVFNENFFFNLPNGFLCYAVILLASTYYLQHKEEEEKISGLKTELAQAELQLAQAQLQALKMQLHPHFLFNTLHSVSALMKDDIKAAREMVTRLGDFLRLTLENSGTNEVTLRDELKFTSCYLDIEGMRFQDRLKVEMAIEPETLDACVPNLILQPLVENAIRHGIMGRVGARRIAIRSSHRDGLLLLEVEDDGPGLRANPGAAYGHGRGFALTRERLEHLYEARQQFLLSDSPTGGLRVTLEMPYRVSSAAHAEALPQGAEQQVAAV